MTSSDVSCHDAAASGRLVPFVDPYLPASHWCAYAWRSKLLSQQLAGLQPLANVTPV